MGVECVVEFDSLESKGKMGHLVSSVGATGLSHRQI